MLEPAMHHRKADSISGRLSMAQNVNPLNRWASEQLPDEIDLLLGKSKHMDKFYCPIP